MLALDEDNSGRIDVQEMADKVDRFRPGLLTEGGRGRGGRPAP
jgi:hypothetical protein